MQGKVCIITGASSGIGRAAAKLFVQNGSTVVALGRSERELKSLRDEILEAEGTLKIQLADVLEATQMEKVINDSIESFGQIDVLVNAAGIILNGSIENTPLEDWDKMMNINLRAVFCLMQKCVPYLE